MSPKNSRFRLLVIFITILVAIAGLTLNLSAYQSQNKGQLQTQNTTDFASLTPPTLSPEELREMNGLPTANVIETFPNSWHASTIGLVYNPVSQTVRYAHEGQATNPETIWDVAYSPPHTPLLGINLTTINGGWPTALNDRDGAEYDPIANTYFLPDYQGDLTNRDDNLIEIDPAGTILNAWELDGAGNDSSDGSALNTVIDIALVPGASPRYFMTRAEGAGTVYEISLTRAGLFMPNTWSTVGSCSIPGGDNVGIDYDAEFGVLYHSSFNDEIIVVTDLDCNVLTSFTCDGPGTAHTGITRIENSDPMEVWVTDFSSNSTTRCAVPLLTLSKVAGLGTDCATPASEVYPGDQVTYCYEVTNQTDPAYTPVFTFTTHSLVDSELGTILENVPYTLTPGAAYSTSVTTFLTQTTTNLATWMATDGNNFQMASAMATVGVLNSSPSLCNTYDSTDVPVAIPDNTTVTSTLAVTDTFTLFDANVALNINHTWDSDLIITLIGPGGDSIPLAVGRGGSGDNFIGTIFDSQAVTPIAAGTPPFSGRFSPDRSLDVLNGQNSDGTWALLIQDTATGDTGSLNAWSVELCEPPVGGLVLTQTVGTTPGVCATSSVITVTAATNVYYCYEITNTGNYTVLFHTLTDSELGTLLDDVYYELGPGESVNTVDLGVNASLTVTQTTTSTSDWAADIPGFIAAQANSTAVVTFLNSAPTAIDDSFVTAADTPLTIAAPGVLANDSDVNGQGLTAALDTGPSNGTLTLNLDGSFIYTPTVGFSGTDSFVYIASDGDLTDTAVVTITVQEQEQQYVIYLPVILKP